MGCGPRGRGGWTLGFGWAGGGPVHLAWLEPWGGSRPGRGRAVQQQRLPPARRRPDSGKEAAGRAAATGVARLEAEGRIRRRAAPMWNHGARAARARPRPAATTARRRLLMRDLREERGS